MSLSSSSCFFLFLSWANSVAVLISATSSPPPTASLAPPPPPLWITVWARGARVSSLSLSSSETMNPTERSLRAASAASVGPLDLEKELNHYLYWSIYSTLKFFLPIWATGLQFSRFVGILSAVKKSILCAENDVCYCRDVYREVKWYQIN